MIVSRETFSNLAGVDVSRETFDKLTTFVDLLLSENNKQNLISRTSVAHIWPRHIADSIQLVALAPQARSWLDIGSGPGLPGMVIAIATAARTLLVEPRRLRTAFLESAIAALGMDDVRVVTASIANVAPSPFDAITARAVAPLDRLIDLTQPFVHAGTILVFPKGRSAAEEVATARRTWQGHIDIIPSRTDTSAGIVVAKGLRRRGT